VQFGTYVQVHEQFTSAKNSRTSVLREMSKESICPEPTLWKEYQWTSWWYCLYQQSISCNM